MTAKRAKSTTTTRKPKAKAASAAPMKRVQVRKKTAIVPARPIAKAPAKRAAKTAAKAGHKQVRKPSPVAAGRKAKAR